MSHSTKPIVQLERYFGEGVVPTIVASFVPGRGWMPYPFRKKASRAWLLKMRAAGVTEVALRAGGRSADFRIVELLSIADLAQLAPKVD